MRTFLVANNPLTMDRPDVQTYPGNVTAGPHGVVSRDHSLLSDRPTATAYLIIACASNTPIAKIIRTPWSACPHQQFLDGESNATISSSMDMTPPRKPFGLEVCLVALLAGGGRRIEGAVLCVCCMRGDKRCMSG